MLHIGAQPVASHRAAPRISFATRYSTIWRPNVAALSRSSKFGVVSPHLIDRVAQPHPLRASSSFPEAFFSASPGQESSAATTTPSAGQDSSPPPITTPSEGEGLPVSDTWLGRLFLQLLPGYLFYAPSFIMPIVTAAAAVGAIYGPHIISVVATLPLIRSITPLASLLTAVGTTQPWMGFCSIFLSMLSVWYAFAVMPALDFILGRELRNPVGGDLSIEGATAAISAPAAALKSAAHKKDKIPGGHFSSDTLYRAILYAYVPVTYLVVSISCHLICTHAISTLAFVGAIISAGVANGITFTVAHELLHGSRKMDRTLANVLLALNCYMHWSKSHLLHHVKVATPEDPSSARKGESLWSFLPRSIWGNLVDGYTAEATRRKKKGIAFFSTRNRAIWWVICPAILATIATAAYGVRGLAFFLGQATVGICMLEVVNYIEHYGLSRRKLPSGRYEPVDPRHSWNATALYTNAVAFHLQRHSDHHAHERTPYQLLRDVAEAPQLPTGYPLMMVLATVPPLFSRVMDPLVEKTQGERVAGVGAN